MSTTLRRLMRGRTNLSGAVLVGALLLMWVLLRAPSAGATDCYVKPRPPGCVSALTVLTQQALHLYTSMEGFETRVKGLEGQLEQCGQCAERAKIQAALSRAIDERQQKRAMEDQLFSAYGFGELGVRNFADLRDYVWKGLHASEADREAARRLSVVQNAVALHCLTLYDQSFRIWALPDAERKALLASPQAYAAYASKLPLLQCYEEANPQRLATYLELVSKTCFLQHDFLGQAQEREAFYTCMNERDPITAICTQDALMQWEIGQRKVLHREPPPNACIPYVPSIETLRAYHIRQELSLRVDAAAPSATSSPGKRSAAQLSASRAAPAPPAPSAPRGRPAAPSAAPPGAAPGGASPVPASGSLFMPGFDPYELSPRQLSILTSAPTVKVVHAGARIVVRTVEPIDLTNTDAKRRFRGQAEQPIMFGRETFAPKGADVFLKVVGGPLPGGNLWAPHITVDYTVVDGERVFAPTDDPMPGPGLLVLKDGKVVSRMYPSRDTGPPNILATQALLSFLVTNAIPEAELEAAAQR